MALGELHEYSQKGNKNAKRIKVGNARALDPFKEIELELKVINDLMRK